MYQLGLWACILFCSSITARSDMASRDDQLMVLLNLRCKLPHMSASALAAIIAEFKKSGTPSLGGRKNIRIARENLVNRGTPYGQLHQTVSVIKKTGAATRLLVQHPFAMLHLATEGGGELTSFLERRYDEKPCTKSHRGCFTG